MSARISSRPAGLGAEHVDAPAQRERRALDEQRPARRRRGSEQRLERGSRQLAEHDARQRQSGAQRSAVRARAPRRTPRCRSGAPRAAARRAHPHPDPTTALAHRIPGRQRSFVSREARRGARHGHVAARQAPDQLDTARLSGAAPHRPARRPPRAARPLPRALPSDVGIAARADAHPLGQRAQPHADARDHAQRSERPAVQPHEVEAGDVLHHPPAGAGDLAARPARPRCRADRRAGAGRASTPGRSDRRRSRRRPLSPGCSGSSRQSLPATRGRSASASRPHARAQDRHALVGLQLER